MKKVIIFLVLIIYPTKILAGVTITCAQVPGELEVEVSYAASDDANIPRAFGLDISVDSGATIDSIIDANEKYWVYPGTIQIVDGVVTDEGEPVAPGTDPGACGDLGDSCITIEMGSLYDPCDPDHQEGPPLASSLISFEVSATCTVTISGNAARSNVILEDTSEAPTNLPTTCQVLFECWSGEPHTMDDWHEVGSPACWCSSGDPNANPRQCHGDADGLASGKKNWWVATADLNILKNAWQITNGPTTTPGICADFDRLGSGKKNWRVATADLNILKKHWQITNKPDPNCQDVIGSQE